MFHQNSIRQIAEYLVDRQESIAVAESVTSGLLQAAFSTAPHAMNFFQGGITAYNIGQKARHFAIDPIHALSCNCVSEKMAVDMAISVCQRFTSNWGIGVTGFASPVPESGNKQFAHFAIVNNGAVLRTDKIDFKTEATSNAQLFFANTILDTYAALLKDRIS